MKDLVRQKTSLTEEIEQILNNQIRIEAFASAMYLAMASWADQKGFEGSAEFLYKQSEEEREHMMKLFKYVNDVGGSAISPEVVNITHDFETLRGVFEQGLEQEITNTQSFHRIIDTCYRVKDYTTINFLQWFLQEQVEEEFIFRRALELFDIIGQHGLEIYEVDKKIKDIKYESPT